MKAKLVKVKWNKGKTDNGIDYNYTRVSVLVPIYEDASNEFGMDLMECELGTVEAHQKLLYLKGQLPIDVDLEVSQQMKGKKVLQIVERLDVLTNKAKPLPPV